MESPDPPQPQRHRRRRSSTTREDVLDAAHSLFVADGYTATTVADIAREAGVALQTVYSAVGSKAHLLVALLDRARSDAGIAQIDAAAQAERGAWAVLESGPRVRRAMLEHAGDLLRLLAENAATDPEIASTWHELLERAHAGARTAMRALDRHGALRPGLSAEDAADRASALMHPTSLLFLLDRGWTLDEVEVWLLDTLARTLTTLEPPAAGAP